jgi:hypothetical protein
LPVAIICTGQGNGGDGCCFVECQVCPLRWKAVNGRVFDAAGADLGTVDQAVNGRWSGSQVRSRVKAQVPASGSVILCRAALETIAGDAQAVSNRSRLNSGWNSNAAYVQLVRPAWSRVEQSLGLPAGSYNCSTWRGVNGPECCFALSQATNAALAAVLPAVAVTVRTAGGLL